MLFYIKKMINTQTFESIISNSPKKKTIFGKLSNYDPLKNFINNLYVKLNIPKESFIYSIYYLYNIVKKNNNDLKVILSDTKNFIFTGIILYIKFSFDEKFDIKYICNCCNINYNKYIELEIYILQKLDWKIYYELNDIIKFKMYLEHYMD